MSGPDQRAGEGIEEELARLEASTPAVAHQALQALQAQSEKSDRVYPYLERFGEMLDHKNAFVRIRGLVLIACNAQWDCENKIDGLMDSYLKHITDAKPIVARQCVGQLPTLARQLPALRSKILCALQSANTAGYADSMRPLIDRDIQNAQLEIQNSLESSDCRLSR